jgi:hypothetical protein
MKIQKSKSINVRIAEEDRVEIEKYIKEKTDFEDISSLDEAESIVHAQPKHPQFGQNRAQLAVYRVLGWFAWLVQLNQFLMAITGVLAVLWAWFRHKIKPFIIVVDHRF